MILNSVVAGTGGAAQEMVTFTYSNFKTSHCLYDCYGNELVGSGTIEIPAGSVMICYTPELSSFKESFSGDYSTIVSTTNKYSGYIRVYKINGNVSAELGSGIM